MMLMPSTLGATLGLMEKNAVPMKMALRSNQMPAALGTIHHLSHCALEVVKEKNPAIRLEDMHQVPPWRLAITAVKVNRRVTNLDSSGRGLWPLVKDPAKDSQHARLLDEMMEPQMILELDQAAV